MTRTHTWGLAAALLLAAIPPAAAAQMNGFGIQLGIDDPRGKFTGSPAGASTHTNVKKWMCVIGPSIHLCNIAPSTEGKVCSCPVDGGVFGLAHLMPLATAEK